jgi:uncharacterized membrane protein HdeD (DUF308 family)
MATSGNGVITGGRGSASWRWLMFAGFVSVIAGAAAIVLPLLASIVAEIFIGWVLVLAGVATAIDAFSIRDLARTVARLLLAALMIVAGLYLVLAPIDTLEVVTLILAILFLASGAIRLLVALARRGRGGAGALALSGAFGVAVGILIVLELPSSAAWALGLLVGVDLVFFGFTAIAAASAARGGDPAPA